MNDHSPLPQANRPTSDVQGHWLLARLGKRVLRPGGAALTRSLLTNARLDGAAVIELAPGLGKTARWIASESITSYVGVDADADAAAHVNNLVSDIAPQSRCIVADASATGLPEASADVVIGEAMLTMQSDRGKQAIINEAARLLKPGGRYAIHELALAPDDLDPAIADSIRVDLAKSIRVNARPLTTAEWTELIEAAGLTVLWIEHAPMALLEVRRNIADEGIRGTLRIIKNVLLDRDARKRVLQMRATFTQHKEHLAGIAIVAQSPKEG